MKKQTLLKFKDANEFAKVLAEENVKVMRGVGKTDGREMEDAILGIFLKHYVDILTKEALDEHASNKSLAKDQLYQKTERSLNVMKNLIQAAVADGFTTAMSRFAKQDLEYYCILRTVPPVASATIN